MQHKPHAITLGHLQHVFLGNQFNFICFAAEEIIERELADGEEFKQIAQVSSAKFWGELHRIDPEMFKPVPDDEISDDILIGGWINDEFANEHPFIRQHLDNEKSMMSAVRPFRIKLLELILERHGKHTHLMFTYEPIM